MLLPTELSCVCSTKRNISDVGQEWVGKRVPHRPSETLSGGGPSQATDLSGVGVNHQNRKIREIREKEGKSGTKHKKHRSHGKQVLLSVATENFRPCALEDILVRQSLLEGKRKSSLAGGNILIGLRFSVGL